MPFLGNPPADKYKSLAKQTITGDGSVAYTLSRSVTNAYDMEVFINNIRQEPDTSYSASGNTITFTAAVTASDSCYLIYQGQSVGSINPPTGSVGTTQIANNTVTTAHLHTGLSVPDSNIATMSASKLTGQAATSNMPTGSVLQVVNNSLPVGTLVYTANNLSWISISASDTAVTSKRTNSKWIVNFTGLAACRQARPMSFDIWYSIDGGSNWIDMSGNRDEQNHGGSGLGLTGYWQSGGTDDWYPLSITVTGDISVNIGSNIKFRLAMRNGGPSTDTASTTNCVGHGDYNMQMTVQEIAG